MYVSDGSTLHEHLLKFEYNRIQFSLFSKSITYANHFDSLWYKIKNQFLTFCHTSKNWHGFCFVHNGELAEWSNAPDSKSGSPLRARGFESHTQKIHSIIIKAVYTAFFLSNLDSNFNPDYFQPTLYEKGDCSVWMIANSLDNSPVFLISHCGILDAENMCSDFIIRI